MTRFALLALTLFIASCKSDKPQESNSPSETRISGNDHAELIRQKIDLEKDLEHLIANHHQDSAAQLEAAKDRLAEAYMNLRKAQSEHPALKALTIELSDWNFHARKAQKNGNTEAAKSAAAEILKINQKLTDLSKEQPEIIEARKQVDQINEEILKARLEVARDIPEAQELLQTLDAVEKKLIEATQ